MTIIGRCVCVDRQHHQVPVEMSSERETVSAAADDQQPNPVSSDVTWANSDVIIQQDAGVMM